MVHGLSHTRRLMGGVVVAAVTVALAAGCGLTGANDKSPQAGHALTEAGFASEGTLTMPASKGHVYGFALDTLSNVSKTPITFESARVDHLPPGVRFVKMGLYSAEETGGTIMGGTDSNWNGSDKDGTDYGKFQNHYGQPIVIRPRSGPLYYPVVFVRFEADHDVTMHDCTIFYKQGGKHYQQHQYCEFKLSTHELLPPRAKS